MRRTDGRILRRREIGRTNIINAELKIENNDCFLVFADGYRLKMDNILDEEKKDQKVIVAARPEEVVINDREGIKAKVCDSVFLGLNTHYFVLSDSVKCVNMDEKNDERIELIQESLIDDIIPNGNEVLLRLKSEKINVFTEDGSKNIVTGVKNDNK